MSVKKVSRNIALFLIGLALAGGYAYFRFQENLKPMPAGPAQVIRYPAKMPISTVLSDLEKRGIIKSAAAMGVYAKYRSKVVAVDDGTYSLKPGMTTNEVFKALQTPITVRVTVPEYYWIDRTAKLMEEKGVATKQEFDELAAKPAEFKDAVEFPLPQKSLEGYLFPDTYKIEPMVGAKSVITQQLKTFQKRVWEGLNKPKNLHRAVIIASLVEREAKLDSERPMVAGVIENRLAKGMPLEIDATVLYAQQDWHEPTPADIRNTISPYNTYLNKGLPPGPICSPGLKSIQAALNPARHDYFFYVALPDGSSLFARTYDEHRQNINKRRRALRQSNR